MNPPGNKTRIIATIGPASNSLEKMQALLEAGMNVARLNFSHGDFDSHGRNIRLLRQAAETTGRRLAIMADLPGPKIRVGEMQDAVQLVRGDEIILTTDTVMGDRHRVSVSLPQLPAIVKPGAHLYLNDGLISLEVIRVDGNDVLCQVQAGGELSSHKGLNLPGINLGFSAFTPHDRDCLEYALSQGVDAVSQSFVSSASDIHELRAAMDDMGRQAFVISKIERKSALDNLEGILDASDGIMIARGDLGVEIPLSGIAMVQKELMRKAIESGKPVITATQMLESMTESRLPTRAEATDVANAIIDGTDAVMLSAESAVGRYPLESVEMLARIARDTEAKMPAPTPEERRRLFEETSAVDLIAECVQQVVFAMRQPQVVVPTRSGATARTIARYRLPVWITAFSSQHASCQNLQFSRGVYPVKVDQEYEDWTPFCRAWLREQGYRTGAAVLTQGPSPEHPDATYRMEIAALD
ncbi:pyruvate kinase [Thiolapillus brandeum]|uniref:Pyruvate kinase n=1 Tax=Thiolapillus brandeum TaxID=1076588 RepID=A0A7U6GK81_9GAMM|nr:pyruvate kinase [Thiolapillus brandeum]BAO45132.1 pyruvate kinase [Thiolapillus brandeum]